FHKTYHLILKFFGLDGWTICLGTLDSARRLSERNCNVPKFGTNRKISQIKMSTKQENYEDIAICDGKFLKHGKLCTFPKACVDTGWGGFLQIDLKSPETGHKNPSKMLAEFPRQKQHCEYVVLEAYKNLILSFLDEKVGGSHSSLGLLGPSIGAVKFL
ncbi:hypothetical protein KI387_005885, partial [Taxus chinensis]